MGLGRGEQAGAVGCRPGPWGAARGRGVQPGAVGSRLACCPFSLRGGLGSAAVPTCTDLASRRMSLCGLGDGRRHDVWPFLLVQSVLLAVVESFTRRVHVWPAEFSLSEKGWTDVSRQKGFCVSGRASGLAATEKTALRLRGCAPPFASTSCKDGTRGSKKRHRHPRQVRSPTPADRAPPVREACLQRRIGSRDCRSAWDRSLGVMWVRRRRLT